MANQAAWITKPKARPLEVDFAADPKAGLGEVVIKNSAVSINPLDCKRLPLSK